MENNNTTTKPDSEETKSSADQNPGSEAPPPAAVEEELPGSDGSRQPRTPFTNLSQVDADLALARTLQEQERAYMMLRMNGNGGGYGGWEAGGYVLEDGEDFDDLSDDEFDGLDAEVEEGEEGEEDNDDGDDEDDDEDDEEDEEDAFDVHAHAEDGEDSDLSDSVDLDPASFPNDEAYARALQDAEDREMAARLLALAGLNGRAGASASASEADDMEDHGDNSQDTWEEVDPDELSYEELLALGEIVGTESRGLSADSIASLPSVNYKMQSAQDGNTDSCVICRLDYEEEDTLTVLSCKHSYHSECLHNWLRINKVCPVCSAEVPSASGNS